MKHIIEFDSEEDSYMLYRIILSDKAWDAISDIKNIVRSRLKHGSSKSDEDLFLEIKNIAFEVTDLLDEISS